MICKWNGMQLDRPMKKMQCSWDISGLTNFLVDPVRSWSGHRAPGNENHAGLQHMKYGVFLQRIRHGVLWEGF